MKSGNAVRHAWTRRQFSHTKDANGEKSKEISMIEERGPEMLDGLVATYNGRVRKLTA